MKYTPGGDVVADDVIIETGATFNAGSDTLTIGGKFENSGTFTAGSSSVTFNGTVDQNITSNSSPFNNITINKLIIKIYIY